MDSLGWIGILPGLECVVLATACTHTRDARQFLKEVIQLNRSPIIADAEKFVEGIVRLAQEFPGQPVGIFALDDGGLRVGVLNLLDPGPDDWCIDPVGPAQIIHMVDNQDAS